MKTRNFFQTIALCCFLFVHIGATLGQEHVEDDGRDEGTSLRHSTHLLSFYSEVDYRIAKNYIEDYKTQVGNQQSPKIIGMNMHPSLSAAIENAQFKSQYKANDTFNGVRVYYGMKADKKVAVVMPLTAQGRLKKPADHEKVYVVDLPTKFHDPCPSLCD